MTEILQSICQMLPVKEHERRLLCYYISLSHMQLSKTGDGNGNGIGFRRRLAADHIADPWVQPNFTSVHNFA